MVFAKSALGAVLLACLAVNALAYSGKSTSYAKDGQGINGGGTGFNACGMHSLPGKYKTYFAALSYKIFSQSNCGKCAKVCARGNCVNVMVVDECASCYSAGHIDLSEPAMEVLTGSGYDETSSTWEFTSCSGGGEVSGGGPVSRKQKRSKKGKKSRRGLLAVAGEQ